jgi:hypothetical protein
MNIITLLVPLPLSTIKDMAKSIGPLDPDDLSIMVDKFGFNYRSLTGMLIFAVLIGRFDIAPDVSILRKYNDRPDTVHFQAAKIVVQYIHTTIDHGLVYSHPTVNERP